MYRPNYLGEEVAIGAIPVEIFGDDAGEEASIADAETAEGDQQRDGGRDGQVHRESVAESLQKKHLGYVHVLFNDGVFNDGTWMQILQANLPSPKQKRAANDWMTKT